MIFRGWGLFWILGNALGMLAWFYVTNTLGTTHASDSERKKQCTSTNTSHPLSCGSLLWFSSPQEEKPLCTQTGDLLGLYPSFLWGTFTYHMPERNTTQQRGTSLKDPWVCARQHSDTAGEESTREGAPLDLLFTNREGIVGDVMARGHLWAQISWNYNFWFLEK